MNITNQTFDSLINLLTKPKWGEIIMEELKVIFAKARKKAKKKAAPKKKKKAAKRKPAKKKKKKR